MDAPGLADVLRVRSQLDQARAAFEEREACVRELEARLAVAKQALERDRRGLDGAERAVAEILAAMRDRDETDAADSWKK